MSCFVLELASSVHRQNFVQLRSNRTFIAVFCFLSPGSPFFCIFMLPRIPGVSSCPTAITASHGRSIRYGGKEHLIYSDMLVRLLPKTP